MIILSLTKQSATCCQNKIRHSAMPLWAFSATKNYWVNVILPSQSFTDGVPLRM